MNDQKRGQGTGPNQDAFELDRLRGNAGLRQLYRERVKSDLDGFLADASLVDLMLLRDLLQTWWGFSESKDSEETILAGAMFELFDELKAGGPEAATETTPDREFKTPYFNLKEAEGRSDRAAITWAIRRCRNAFNDWVRKGTPGEIAMLSNVLALADSGGDLAGNFLDALGLDADQLLGKETDEGIAGPVYSAKKGTTNA